MKKFKLISIAVVVVIVCMATTLQAQKKAKEESLDMKVIENSVAKITDNLYAGKYEVSNFLWIMFQKDLKAANKLDELKTAQVDSLNWRDKLAYNEPYVAYYFRHPAYNNYPVVNISYEGAVLFCKWLTEKYNAYPKRQFKKVLFRLPTETEWRKVAGGTSKISAYPWGDRLILNGKYMCNYRVIGDENITFRKDLNKFEVVKNQNSGVGSMNDAADITAPVTAYFPNTYGLFNVCGNVAEMIAEKGKIYGGGWRNSGWDVRTDAVDSYTTTATDIGFRYFMDIVEK